MLDHTTTLPVDILQQVVLASAHVLTLFRISTVDKNKAGVVKSHLPLRASTTERPMKPFVAKGDARLDFDALGCITPMATCPVLPPSALCTRVEPDDFAMCWVAPLFYTIKCLLYLLVAHQYELLHFMRLICYGRRRSFLLRARF